MFERGNRLQMFSVLRGGYTMDVDATFVLYVLEQRQTTELKAQGQEIA
jgi:hypothetical protein